MEPCIQEYTLFYRALLQKRPTILPAYRALLSIYRARSDVYRALLRVYQALLRVNRALLGVCHHVHCKKSHA